MNLEKIFPPVIVPAKDIVGIQLELFDYQRDFGGKSRNRDANKIYKRDTNSFRLM